MNVLGTLQFYCKMFAVGVWCLLVSLVFYLVSFAFAGRTWLSWAYARYLNAGAHFIFGIKVVVSGRENMVTGPAVILMNHQSNFDPLLQAPVFPKNAVVIGKKSLLKIPLWGRLLKASNNILVDRDKKRQGAVIVSAAVERLEEDDCYIWIFPEGTRNHGKGLGAFKKGAFSIAINAGVPLIPMISGPMSPVLDVSRKSAPGGIYEITILPPIETTDLGPGDVESLMAECRELYLHYLGSD